MEWEIPSAHNTKCGKGDDYEKNGTDLCAGLFLAAPAFADAVRINGKLVVEGDSVSRVLKAAGKPDRIVQLENRYGAGVGERWEYYITGYNSKTITITFSGGQVVSTRIIDG